MIGIIIVVVLVLVSTLIVVNNQRYQKKQIKQLSNIEIKEPFFKKGTKDELLARFSNLLKEEFVVPKRLFLVNFIKDKEILFQCVHALQDPLGLDPDLENDVTVFLNLKDHTEKDQLFQAMEAKNSFRKDIVKDEPYYSKNYKFDSEILLTDLSEILSNLYHINDSDALEIEYYDQGPIYINN